MSFKKEFPSKSLNLHVLVVIPTEYEIMTLDICLYNGLRQYLINWYFDITFIKTSNKLENWIQHNYLITSLKIKSIQRN